MKATVNYGPVGVLVISAEQSRYGCTKYFKLFAELHNILGDIFRLC